MSWLAEAALLYLTGAVIMGAIAATSDDVKATYKWRRLPFQRFAGSAIIGMLWPVALVQSIFNFNSGRNR